MKTAHARRVFAILIVIAGLTGAWDHAQVPPPPNRAPELAAILDKLGAFSVSFRQQFHNYIAEEHDVQKRYKLTGALDHERRVTSDYYMVTLPSDPSKLYDFREVLEVDGKSVRRRHESLVKMLNQNGGSVTKEIDRFKEESNRYELFLGKRFLSSVALLLPLYGAPENQKHTEFNIIKEESSGPEELVLVFKELGTDTILRYIRRDQPPLPLKATGRLYLAKADCRILKADVSVTHLGDDGTPIGLRYVVEYRPAPDGQMLPRRRLVFVSSSKWKNGLIAESEATYSNFRRFGADSRIVSWELP